MGIVLEKRVLKKRVMVMPKVGGSKRRKSNNLVEAESLWELTVGSFKSCCINVVLVEKGSMRDFVTPGAIVKYAVPKRERVAKLQERAAAPPLKATRKVKGVDFQLLGILHSKPDRKASQKTDLLRAWARPYLTSETTHIESLNEGLSSVELALIKARIVEIDRIQISVVAAAPDTGGGKAKGPKLPVLPRSKEKKTNNRKRKREGSGTSGNKTQPLYHVSLSFEIEDYTGRARCQAANEVAMDILKLVDSGKWSTVVGFCGRISRFYGRDCKIAIVKQPKAGVKYQLEMSDFVDLSYPLYKDFYKSILDLCSFVCQSDSLYFICQHGGNATGGAGHKRDLIQLQALHSEKPICLYECLKHSIS